ncbi:MAG: flagellar M-ring protein FliF [Firmicutes bacterium]|nr:flagellar M-ring protein FliF [Bacillota bacterium]
MNEFFSRLREQSLGIWRGMDKPRRWLVLGITSGALLLLILGTMRFAGDDYVPVFTKMQPEDAAEVVAFLKDQNIAYQIGQQGSAVLVPQGKVHEVRMQLASQGLPRGGVVGLELWDHTSLTETDFDRRIRLLRALQGELTRTLMGLEAIENARVHIVLPENSLFIEAQNPATASVFLVLKQGHVLQENQIRGIAHLMASSVEGLLPENVTIIDNRGNVLSDRLVANSGVVNSGQVLQQLEIERSYERDVERSIQAMLERVFGLGRVVVRVNASLDFNYEELREKRSEPVVGSKGVVISEETRSETYRGTGGGGVPGVASNVPGYTAPAVTGESEYEKEEVTRNYEISISEKYRVKAPGEVQNLSVAVWVDGELTEEQRERVVAMVSSAAGLQPERGDVVQVDGMAFAADLAAPAGVPDGITPGRTWDWRVLLLLPLALLLLLFATRRRGVEPVPAEESVPTIDLLADEEEEIMERPLSPEEERRLRVRREIERMSDEDPEGLARLIRAWMAEE